MDETLTSGAGSVPLRRRWPYLLPIAICLAVGVFLYLGLYPRPDTGPLPTRRQARPAVLARSGQGRALGLSSQDLRGEVALVNVFASWCVACRQEHPLFLALEREGAVPIHGLNYKDAPDDAAPGSMRSRSVHPDRGRPRRPHGSRLGRVRGARDVSVVDRDGRIAYKHIGPVTPRVLDEDHPSSRAQSSRKELRPRWPARWNAAVSSSCVPRRR